MASRRNFLRSGLVAGLRGIPLGFARVGWIVAFVLTVGSFIVSIPAYYDWLANLSRPELEPAIVRTNLEAVGISIDWYATFELSISAASAMVFTVVSVTIFWRRSDDWMALLTSLGLLAFGIFFLTEGPVVLAEQYPVLWLPVRSLAFLGSMSFILFLYLFPNGRFLPRWTRWIPIFWAAHEVGYYFFPNTIFNINRTFPLLDFVVSSTFLIIGAGSQLYHYRRVSGPIQRQQTKWAVFGMVSAALGAIIFALPLNISPTLAQYGSPYTFALEAGIYGSLLLIPLSIGVAILRHRLWDIDIVINRTLVYGILTVSLALVYFGGVTAAEAVFRALTGQEEQPQLAIVVSTLVIAALFSPLRHRIQGFIDRSFYRRKYDARKTLETFSAKLRDETDLDALSDDLVEVVKATMQPVHISLWLRPDRGRGTHHAPSPGEGRIPHGAQETVQYRAAGEGQGASRRLDSNAEG
jgi:hypothetical protein